MTLAERGVAVTLMAVAWDSERTGYLPADLTLLSKITAISPRILRDFTANYPRFARRMGDEYQIERLAEQADNYRRLSTIRSNAAKSRYPANAEQMHLQNAHTASASAPASAKSNTTPPTPPLTRGEESFFEWQRQTIGVRMNGRRRLFSDRERENLAGARAEEVVEFLKRKGLLARIVVTQ